MYRICKSFTFSAAHVLTGLAEGHPCGRLHGHNYHVEVELTAETLDRIGFVLDYRLMDAFKSFLDNEVDHRVLNEVFPSVGEVEFNPTAENLATVLFQIASEMFTTPERQVSAVYVRETDKTWAEYRP